jgi:hypothetical protein
MCESGDAASSPQLAEQVSLIDSVAEADRSNSSHFPASFERSCVGHLICPL